MFGLSARNLNRYREIATLLYRHGRSDLVRDSGLAGMVDCGADNESQSEPEQLARDLERMGPAFVKLGQLLSTRADLLPEVYLDALSRLQDNAGSVDWSEISATIEQELGARVKAIFAKVDEHPIACASLGQVHRATLRDGREIVIKVQRPGIVEVLQQDVQAFQELAKCLHTYSEFGRQFQVDRLVESLEWSLKQELDYVKEAHNMVQLRQNLADHPRILVPQPLIDLTTSRVLTMEYIAGSKITDLHESVLLELNRMKLADDIFDAYLQQVLIDGVFHADPHPGNLSLTHDHKIALMDFGLVVHVSPSLRSQLVRLMLALADGEGERAAHIAEEFGEVTRRFNAAEFRRKVVRIVTESIGTSVEDLSVGRTLIAIQRSAGHNGLILPDEVVLLGKTMMNLDRVLIVLAPDFDPSRAIRQHATSIMSRHGESKISLTALYQSLVDSAEFAQQLPARANAILKLAADNELRIKVDAVDEESLIHGIHKVANRITAGLIVAALIIGASLIMRLETPWKIAGYPALATFFFVGSAIAGCYLWWQAMFGDRKPTS